MAHDFYLINIVTTSDIHCNPKTISDPDLLRAGPGPEPRGAQVLGAPRGARQHAHLRPRRQRRSLRRPRLLRELHHLQEPRRPGRIDGQSVTVSLTQKRAVTSCVH